MAESFENKLISFLNKLPAMREKSSRKQLLNNLPDNPKSTIPSSDSQIDDLTSIVQAAIGWGKLSSGEFAIKKVMTNARYFVEGLMLQTQLDELIIDFESELNLKQHEEIEIPFVIVAMTQDEANQLREMTLNQLGAGNDELKKFQDLTQMIKEHGIQDFINYYSEIREGWKPYICQESTIQAVIITMVEEINCYRSEIANLPLVQPKFLSHECLGLDDSKRVSAWNELRQMGCVLIVDSISLFHPKVQEKLLKAEITSNENVAILVLSPINPYAIQANQLLEQTISYQMEPAFFRFNEELDKLCEIGIGDLRAMRRWFFSVIPETAEIIIKQKPQLKNKLGLRKKMGPRNGVDTLWTKR